MIQLDEQAHAVVRQMEFNEEGTLQITCGQLDRKLYDNVSRALKAIGGKWSKKHQGFLFDRDFEANFLVLRDQGHFDRLDSLDFYATPKDMALQVVREMPMFSLEHEYLAYLAQEPHRAFRMLEPSAGHGALADAFKEVYQEAFPESDNLVIECVEMDPVNAQVLRGKGYIVHECDFMEFESQHKFDAVVMNPPFNLRGKKDCYIDHIDRALGMLNRDGQLKAIAPSNLLMCNSAAKEDMLARILRSRGEILREGEYSNRGAFASVGANIETVGLSLSRSAHPDHLPEIDWQLMMAEICNGGTIDLFRTLDEEIYRRKGSGLNISKDEFEALLLPIEKSAISKGVFIPKDDLPSFRREMADRMDLSSLYKDPAPATVFELPAAALEAQPELAKLVSEQPLRIKSFSIRRPAARPDFSRM